MKSKVTSFVLVVLVVASWMILPGCYTQVVSTKDDELSSSGREDTRYDDDDRGRNSYGYSDNYSGSQYRGGFSYYYPSQGMWPSSSFSAAYNDPWSYGLYGSSYGYGSNYGSYYGYGGGYGYGYGSSYYSPYSSSYYPGYYYGAGYSIAPAYRRVRDFGSTRGYGSGRDVESRRGASYDAPSLDRTGSSGSAGSLPTGNSLQKRGSSGSTDVRTPDANVPRVQEGSRRGGTSRGTSGGQQVTKDGTTRGSGSQGSSGSRGEAGRDQRRPAITPPASNDAPTAPAPPPQKDNTVRPDRSSGTRDAGTQRTPPPPPPKSDDQQSRSTSPSGRRP